MWTILIRRDGEHNNRIKNTTKRNKIDENGQKQLTLTRSTTSLGQPINIQFKEMTIFCWESEEGNTCDRGEGGRVNKLLEIKDIT